MISDYFWIPPTARCRLGTCQLRRRGPPRGPLRTEATPFGVAHRVALGPEIQRRAFSAHP